MYWAITILLFTVLVNTLLLLATRTSESTLLLKHIFQIHILSIIGWAFFIVLMLVNADVYGFPTYEPMSFGYLAAQLVFVFASIMVCTNFWFVHHFIPTYFGRNVVASTMAILQGITAVLCVVPNTLYSTLVVNPAGYVDLTLLPLNGVYSLFLLTHFLVPLFILFCASRRPDHRQTQSQILLLFYFLFFVLSMTFNWVLPVYFEIFNLNSLGPTTSLVLVIGLTYAIMRHQFLDIRILIQRGLIYTILFSFIALLFFVAIHGAGALFPYSDYSESHYINQIIVGVIATILGTLLVPKLDQFLRRKTDPVFFKDTYNYSDGLKQLSESVNQNIRLENITKTSSAALKEILRAKEVRIFEISHCRKTELPTNTVPAQTLNVPIQHKNTLIGCIEIDEKRSGDNYTARDLSLIETFANQIATAFEKARLYKEVEDYSHTLEERVAERTSEVEALQENRKQIMLDISHQLQTPLTVVKNGIYEMKHAHPASPNIKAFEKSIDSVSQFIYQMLHLASLEKSQTQKVRVDLSELLIELAEYYLVICLDKKITLKSNITRGLFIHGDKKQLEEAITSIVSNAVKYMHPIDSGRSRRISITLLQQESSVEIIINDTGIGISADALPQVFNRFYRAKSSAMRIDGNGLGLAIADKIISLHNGTISATSTEGSGSTFVITMPLYNV